MYLKMQYPSNLDVLSKQLNSGVFTEELNSALKELFPDAFTNHYAVSKSKKISVTNAEAHVDENSNIMVYVDTPGCSKDSITADITDDRTITISYKHRDVDKTATVIVDEDMYDVNDVQIKYENGQLTLTLNKRQEKPKRTITID